MHSLSTGYEQFSGLLLINAVPFTGFQRVTLHLDEKSPTRTNAFPFSVGYQADALIDLGWVAFRGFVLVSGLVKSERIIQHEPACKD
jgi:hypothetical protein